MRIFAGAILASVLALPLTAQANTLDEYLEFMVFDCTLSGTEPFDIQDAATAASEHLGFEVADVVDEQLTRYINADGARMAIVANDDDPRCSVWVPPAIHSTRPDTEYPYRALELTYDRLHDDLEVEAGTFGGLDYRMKIEWGYRVEVSLREERDGDLIFTATTRNPE